MKKQQGFTLIELLVVIAIIGILSSVVIASLNSARAKSRDAKRMQEIQQIHTALEMYTNDHGVAPDLGINGCLEPSGNTDCIAYDYDSVLALTSQERSSLALFTPLTAHAQRGPAMAGEETKGGDFGQLTPVNEDSDTPVELVTLSGGKWDRFGQQLKPYIAAVARDAKSANGSEYGYIYEAPGAQSSGTSSSYRLYAKKFESKDGMFGYGLDGGSK